tara:strand:+ start:508 stop:1332 length:825 start_codon:yes stop_codon:yes gene_type:complete
MEYLTGYTIKPHTITGLGEVFFTDGTNTGIRANQVTCEAYGYTYDIASGTCSSFRFNTNLNRNINNINNKFNGAGNTTETGSNTIQINGTNNTTKGFNNNCLINGSNNEVGNGINNATVLSNYGEALRDGEVVIGGGGFSGTGKGYAQNSVVTLTGTTTDATPTSLFVNGDAAITAIARDAASFSGFEANIIGVRTGGGSGSGAVNDRIFLRATGLLYLVSKDLTVTTLSSYGTVTGWTTAISFSGADLLLQVTGVEEMDISWSATVNFYEMKI